MIIPSNAPYNILVVEDDQNVALAIEAILTKGFADSRVIRVSNCRMAMDCLQTDPIKLIISDWNMPSRTGADLLQDVRHSNHTKHIPFLMVTARFDRESVVTAIRNGANDYICKPFEKHSMLTKVGRLLGVTPTLPKERPSMDIPAASLKEFASAKTPPTSAD